MLGADAVRAARHRVEHVELVPAGAAGTFVDLEVVASMQPAFDGLWGGDTGMYAERLGLARSLASNPMAALAGVGVALAFGSDSPVTPLDPWGAVRAAVHHHPGSRMGAAAAFAAHTRGGWAAARRPGGQLAAGAPATSRSGTPPASPT